MSVASSKQGANTLVGQAVERAEDRRLLLGQGQFADDYEPIGVVHAAILRSSVAHGRIIGLDIAPALRLPGVHAVITAKLVGPDIPRIPLRLAPIQGFEKYLQPVIASDKVRYAGEPVAVVLAESRAVAEDALELIDLSVDSLDAIPDWRTSATDRSLLFEENGTNISARYSAEIGNTDQAFVSADYTR